MPAVTVGRFTSLYSSAVQSLVIAFVIEFSLKSESIYLNRLKYRIITAKSNIRYLKKITNKEQRMQRMERKIQILGTTIHNAFKGPYRANPRKQKEKMKGKGIKRKK